MGYRHWDNDPPPDPAKHLLDKRQAASYCGLTVAGLAYHLWTVEEPYRLIPDGQFAGAYYFTPATLDHWMANIRRPAHRPKTKPIEEM